MAEQTNDRFAIRCDFCGEYFPITPLSETSKSNHMVFMRTATDGYGPKHITKPWRK